jgi:hypothetical protein
MPGEAAARPAARATVPLHRLLARGPERGLPSSPDTVLQPFDGTSYLSMHRLF